MARTKQVQKTRAKTSTKTEITQKQSLEAVQTLIHGGLSCLTYIRSLFAEKAYDTHYYRLGPITPYDEYANGKLPTKATTLEKPVTKMQVLRRNRSRRVDTFLDWLENAAFPLLADGRLHAIQIYVHQDGENRDRVLETYSFTIRYHPDGSGVKSPVGIEVGSQEGRPTTGLKANLSLQDVLREITELCQGLPNLPANRFVSTNLFYCSEDDVDPQGFTPSTSNQLLFAHSQGWKNQTSNVPMLGTSFHSTSFKVSHLVFPGLEPAILKDTEEPPPDFPEELEYPEITTRLGELELDSSATEDQATVVEDQATVVEDEATVIEDSPIQPAKAHNRTSSITFGGEPGKRRSHRLQAKQMETPAPTMEAASDLTTQQKESNVLVADTQAMSLEPAPLFHDSLDTQSSQVPRMRRALRGMLESEPLTQGDTQTQADMSSVPPTPVNAGGEATPTTASGLDLRASVAPYQTPMLPRYPSAKRSREEEDVFARPAQLSATNTPVLKRLRTVQSQVILNANGLSSSPAPPPWP